jgi:hypothetical protein
VFQNVGLLALIALVSATAMASVVDRVAVVVGKTIFTESEVNEEARLTQLEAGKPLDLSAAQRKEAAERLVDRELLRQEMAASGTLSGTTDTSALLRAFRQRRFPAIAEYHAALTRYGVTEDALKQRLLWEAEMMRFTDERFRAFTPPPDDQSADRSGNAAPAAPSADQQLDAWLKQQRASTRVVFVQEAFR